MDTIELLSWYCSFLSTLNVSLGTHCPDEGLSATAYRVAQPAIEFLSASVRGAQPSTRPVRGSGSKGLLPGMHWHDLGQNSKHFLEEMKV